MKKFFSILMSCTLLLGCVSTLKIEPLALDEQLEINQNGVETVISPKNALVAIRPLTNTYSTDARPTLVVSVLNGTEKPFNFSTENIRVFVDGTPHKIFTYDELVTEVQRLQVWGALSGVAQPMNAANAGYSSSYGIPNVYVYDKYGDSAYESDSYSYYIRDAAAAQQAQADANAQAQANTQVIKNQTKLSLNSFSSAMLKKTTVFPQSWHGGFAIMAEIPNPTQPHLIAVIISAAGESHTFVLNHIKVEQ